MAQKYSGKTITGFVFSIIGLLFPIFFFFSLIGLLLCIREKKSKRTGLATAGIVMSIIGLILFVVIALTFYLFAFYLPERDFQENKVSLILSPISSNANTLEDSQILRTRFLSISGRVEVEAIQDKIYLNISKEIFDSELYLNMINKSRFEAKVGEDIVFSGNQNDIIYVGRTGMDAGLTECFAIDGGEACNFRFIIYISDDVATNFADITSSLNADIENGGRYLSKTIDFYLDGELTDSLNIGIDLKGKFATQIQISGSGTGQTREEAIRDSEKNMNHLQAILISGELSSDYQVV